MKFVKKLQMLSVLSTLVIVSGCAKTKICYNSAPKYYNLPEVPIAGPKVADELDKFCLPDNGQCKNINKWLNDLYIFKIKYGIYRGNLK